MKSTRTLHVATAATTEEIEVGFGASGGMKYTVVVPAGTRCRKLDGGSDPWVVADLSFIQDKQGALYHEAEHYGIRIPEAQLANLQTA